MATTDYAVISWRTSSFSGTNAGNCVEVGVAADAILVRDTKNRLGPTLTLTPTTWHALTTTLRA